MDEMPELEGEAPDEYAENGTAAVTTFTARDPEGKSIVWSLAGADAAAFSIENGVLRFESSPDYEAVGGDNDNHMKSWSRHPTAEQPPTTKEVTIEITNVEEPGTVTLTTLQPQVDVMIMATLADPDIVEGAILNTITGSGTGATAHLGRD